MPLIACSYPRGNTVKVTRLWPRFSFFIFLIILAMTAAGCAGGAASTPPPETAMPSVTMSVTPQSVAPGGSATLSWQSQNADVVRIDNGIGKVALSGEMTVNPAQNTTYTATATKNNKTASASTS